MSGEVRYYAYRHITSLAETNLVSNVYFAHHLFWQGRCREMFLREHAPDVLEELRGGLRLVTLSCGCRYFTELDAFGAVELRMRLREIVQNTIAMDFEYWVERAGSPVLAARGEQQVACMRLTDEGLAPARIPEALERALKPYSCSHSPRGEA
jgi:enediyne biosynthesis thioesterase